MQFLGGFTFPGPVKTTTVSYAMAATDNIVEITGSGTGIIITLPLLSAVPTGWVCLITSASSGTAWQMKMAGADKYNAVTGVNQTANLGNSPGWTNMMISYGTIWCVYSGT